MKRPIFVAVIGFIIGILMGLYFEFSIVFFYIFMIAIYFIVKKVLKSKRKFKLISFRRYFRYFKLYITKKVIILFIISSIISNAMVLWQNQKYQSLYQDNETLNIIGIIISNKEELEYQDRYCVKVIDANQNTKYKGTKLYLKLSKKIELEYGDKVEVTGSFIEPKVSRNYGGFSNKEYLKTLKIYGTVKAENVSVIAKNQANIIFMLANNVKIKLEENIDNLLEQEKASIFKGILLGDTSNIEDEIQESFRNSNISHILAVSGMHVAYIILGINLLFRTGLGKRQTRYLVILVLICYMFLTGFSPSIVRAAIMGIIVTLGGIFHRKNDIWTSISFSLLLLLLQNPFAITSIGLQLSYLGTIGIIVFHSKVLNFLKRINIKNPKIKYAIPKKLTSITDKIKEILAVTISAQIAILPVMLYHFNLIGIYFLITNLLISIVIGPILILGIIVIAISFFAFPISKVLSIILNLGIIVLLDISKIGDLPLSKIYLPTPSVWQITLYYIFLFVLNFIYSLYNSKEVTSTKRRFRNLLALFKHKIWIKRKKYLKILTLVTSLIIIVLSVFPRNLKIHFVDVGQGDCTFIVTPKNHTILIDGGGSILGEFDIGKSTLLPYILDRGYTSIDYILISHFDQDHVGGILSILEEIKVGQVIITRQSENSENYQKFLEQVENKKIKVKQVKKGDRVIIERNLFVDILWPQEEQIADNPLNNNSMVAKLQYFDFSMLFTGDIEKIAEQQILEVTTSEYLRADILKVAHHGSNTSSTSEFINAVKPKIALIGVGKNNNFGHPAEEVIDRFQSIKTEIYRTDKMGEIVLEVNKKGICKVNNCINLTKPVNTSKKYLRRNCYE